MKKDYHPEKKKVSNRTPIDRSPKIFKDRTGTTNIKLITNRNVLLTTINGKWYIR